MIVELGNVKEETKGLPGPGNDGGTPPNQFPFT